MAIAVTTNLKADVLAQDRDGRPVLVVETKSKKIGVENGRALLASYLQASRLAIPFAMTVDLDTIQIFRWDGTELSAPICTLISGDVLGHYDSEFSSKRIFGPYLTTLVEAWLRDLAYHWKSDKPPAADQLSAIGLAPLLESGDTFSEVDLARESLR